MEILDLAQQIERSAQQQRALVSQISSDLSQLRQDFVRLSSAQQNSGSYGMGQSVERAFHNLSLSILTFGDKFKLALIWGAGILGVTMAVMLTVLLVILLGGGAY